MITRTHEFSVNDSKAYSWLSLRNVLGAGPSATHSTIAILDHCMASKIDEPTKSPVTTTKTHEFKDYMTANSLLRLGNIRVAESNGIGMGDKL